MAQDTSKDKTDVVVRLDLFDARERKKTAIEEAQARAPGFTSSVVKLIGTLSKQERDELHLSALGSNGLGWEGDEFPKEALKHTRTWLQQKSLTIAGGTAEIQLNIIAKRVLGLPD